MTTEQIRDRLADVLKRVQAGDERIVLSEHGKDIAAIVSMDDLVLLAKVLEHLEDLADVEAAKQALADPERIPYEQIRKEFGLA